MRLKRPKRLKGSAGGQRRAVRRRRALVITETELKLMAAAAIIGFSEQSEDRVEHPRSKRYTKSVIDKGEEEILADVAAWFARSDDEL